MLSAGTEHSLYGSRDRTGPLCPPRELEEGSPAEKSLELGFEQEPGVLLDLQEVQGSGLSNFGQLISQSGPQLSHLQKRKLC